MSNQITGRIVSVGNLQTFSEKFRKREFVVEIPDGRFSQFGVFQLVNRNADETDVREGDKVDVTFRITGRWNEKSQRYFSSLEATNVEVRGRTKKPRDEPPMPNDDDDLVPF